MASEDLVLDRKVRDWVVVPLTLCILLMMLLRQYVAKVRANAPVACHSDLAAPVVASHSATLQMLANPGSSSQPPDPKEVREKQALGRSQMLRTFAGYLPAPAVQQRRNFLAAKVPCSVKLSAWHIWCTLQHPCTCHTGYRGF